MAKEEATKETTVSFLEALKTGSNQAQVDPDPLEEPGDDEELDIFAGETELEDTKPEKQPTDEEKAEKEKADAKAKWDGDRQKRDEVRAERQKATEVKLEGLTTLVEELSKTHRELLAQFVQGAGKKADEVDEEALSTDPGALAAAISELDPEKAEFPDLVTAFNAIAKNAEGDKAVAAELRKALADQAKRNEEALAKQAKRHDDRDTRDADRAAEDAMVKHLDGVMFSMFKGEQAMRKTVEKRAAEIVAEHGYDPKDQVPLRTANMALTSAAKEVAAKLAAEKRGGEKPPMQDDLAGDFGDVLAKGSQNMQEATKTMGGRAL